MFSIPEEAIRKATKCRAEFSCLRSACCGSSPMCDVEARHADEVLRVSAAQWPSCSYHLDFGGARFCVCPVRSAIFRQQAAQPSDPEVRAGRNAA
jgi:hypothetical protein